MRHDMVLLLGFINGGFSNYFATFAANMQHIISGQMLLVGVWKGGLEGGSGGMQGALIDVPGRLLAMGRARGVFREVRVLRWVFFRV